MALSLILQGDSPVSASLSGQLCELHELQLPGDPQLCLIRLGTLWPPSQLPLPALKLGNPPETAQAARGPQGQFPAREALLRTTHVWGLESHCVVCVVCSVLPFGCFIVLCILSVLCCYLVVSGRKINPVPATPSQPGVEICLLMLVDMFG